MAAKFRFASRFCPFDIDAYPPQFSIEARDEKEVVGKAQHDRVILNTSRFMTKAQAKLK
jgi:predicted thioesterase